MKHNQQMIDAFVRIRAAGASHIDIAKQLGISKNTSCEWSHLHAEAIEETIKDNREDARFYENFQRPEELVNVNKIIKNFLFRIENDRYGFGHTMSYKDTCRMLGVLVKHREYLFKRNGDNSIAVRALPGHPAKRPSPAAAQPPQPSNPGSDEQTHVPEREEFLGEARNEGASVTPRGVPSERMTTHSRKKNHVPAIGTTGMPIPVAEEPPTPKNPNKTNASSEKHPETIPQKNAHPIPVPEEKEPTNLAKSRLGGRVRTTPAAFHTDAHETPKTTNASTTTIQDPPALSEPPLPPRLCVKSTQEHRIDLLNRIEREVADIRSRFPQFAAKSNTKNTPFPAWTAEDRKDHQ